MNAATPLTKPSAVVMRSDSDDRVTASAAERVAPIRCGILMERLCRGKELNEVTVSVVQLWEAGAAPAWDGIYWADGSARAVELVGEARLERLALGPSLDLEAMLSNDPDNLTHVDVVRGADVPIPDGSGYVCGGEGSHGSAGFFARLDRDSNLRWIVSLSCSNPFDAVEVRDSHATFTNNLGYSLTIDLNDPDFS